jgi:hypothetical protein
VTVFISYLNGASSNMTAAIALLERAWSPEWDSLLAVRPLSDLNEVTQGRGSSPENKVVFDVSS